MLLRMKIPSLQRTEGDEKRGTQQQAKVSEPNGRYNCIKLFKFNLFVIVRMSKMSVSLSLRELYAIDQLTFPNNFTLLPKGASECQKYCWGQTYVQ